MSNTPKSPNGQTENHTANQIVRRPPRNSPKLKPWQPGQSGNPKGRKPNANSLSKLIREIGTEVPADQTGELSRLELVVRRLYDDARNGKDQATQTLFERGWGKVTLPISINTSQLLIERAEHYGLSAADIEANPQLAMLFRASGIEIIEGAFKVIDAKLIESEHSAEGSKAAG